MSVWPSTGRPAQVSAGLLSTVRDLSWRQVLSLVLATAALTEVLRFLRIVQYPFRQAGSPFLADFFAAASLLLVGACVAGWAALSIWKEKPSARAWAISGSLVLIMKFFREYAHNAFFPHHPGYDLLLLPGAILGPLIAILWPKPSRSRTISDWHDPPTMFDRGNGSS